MTYEAYEARIRKIQAVLNFIRRNKVILLVILAILLALWASFLSTRGMLLEDYAIEKSEFVFGEQPKPAGRALFGSVSFEYSKDGGKTWGEDAPILPGEYLVRAVSRRSFGARSYGEPQAYTITKRPITLLLNESTLVYGENPTVTAQGLLAGSRVESSSFAFSDPYALGNIGVVLQSIHISDSNGNDVTEGYSFAAPSGTVNVTARPLTVTADSLSRPYDGTVLTSESYTLSGEIATGDTIHLTFPGSILTPGTTDNTPAVILRNAAGDDVSACYTITVPTATLAVTKRPLSVTPHSENRVYDGLPLQAAHTAEGIADALNATVVGVIGRKIILYRRSLNGKRHIEL